MLGGLNLRLSGYLRILILLPALFLGCSHHEQKDSAAILTVGQVKLTRFEWLKQKKAFIFNYESKYKKKPSSNAVKQYAEEFIKYGYILAGAYAKNYDTLPLIRQKVLETSKYMILREHSQLYNRVIKSQVHISEADINLAKLQKKSAIKIAILKFENRDLMLKLLSRDTILKTGPEFSKICAKYKGYSGTISSNLTLLLPSVQLLLLQDKILNMGDGEVSGPIYENNDAANQSVFFLYKIKTEKNLNNGSVESNNLKKLLQYIAEKKRYSQYINGFLTRSALKINDSVLGKLVKNIKYGPNVIMDTSSVSDILKDPFFSYKMGSQMIAYSVNDFIDYYNTKLPIRSKLYNKEQYKDYITELTVNDLIYHQEINQVLILDPLFKLNQDNFMRRTIADQFKKNELFKNISIPEKDLVRAYDARKLAYRIPEYVKFSVFTFDDMSSAYAGIIYIKSLNGDTASNNFRSIKGLRRFASNQKMVYADKRYDIEIVNQLFGMPEHTLTRPFLDHSDVLVLKKEGQSGSGVKPYNQVKDQLRQGLVAEHENNLLTKYISDAKSKFTLHDNFVNDDYVVNQ